MPFWYNAPKDGSKFAQLTPIDWENMGSKDSIHFSEMLISKTPDGWLMGMYVNHAEEVKKAKERDFKFEPQLCSMVLHDKEYTARKFKDDKYQTVQMQPAPLEKLFCRMLESAMSAQQVPPALEGFLGFGSTERTINILLSGQKPDGTPASGDLMMMLADEVAVFIPAELDKLKGVALPVLGDKKSNWGGGSRETEAERLQARLKFALEQLKPYCEGADSVWMAQAAIDTAGGDSERIAAMRAVELLKVVMG